MIAIVRCGTLLGFLALFVACGTADLPTVPGSTAAMPTLGGPATNYQFSGPLSYPDLRGYTMTSKYVVYDSDAFSLQYPSVGREYVGTYLEENGQISFHFTDNGGRWEATGTLNADTLEVRYNLDMSLSDFEDAVYKRSE